MCPLDSTPPPPGTSPDREGRRETALALSIMVVFSLSAMLVAMMPVVTPDLRDELGLSAADVGLLTSAFLLAYALIEFPVSVVVAHAGGRLFAFSGGCLVVGCLLMAVAPSMPVLLAARALQGLGGGSIVVIGGAVLARSVRPRRLDRAWGIVGAGWGVGTIAGLFVFPSVRGTAGYQAVLLTAAAIVFAATVVVLAQRSVRARPPAPEVDVGTYVRDIGGVARNRDLNLLALFNATSLAASVAAVSWTPAMLAETQGAGVEVAAYITAGIGFAQIASNPAGAWACDRWGRRWVLAWSQVALAATLALLPFVPGVALALLLTLLVGFFTMSYFAPIYGSVPLAVSLRVVGVATAWVSVVGMLASLVFPWLFGVLLDAGLGYETGYLTLAAFSLAGVLGVRFLRIR